MADSGEPPPQAGEKKGLGVLHRLILLTLVYREYFIVPHCWHVSELVLPPIFLLVKKKILRCKRYLLPASTKLSARTRAISSLS